jgi:hypothetical protein
MSGLGWVRMNSIGSESCFLTFRYDHGVEGDHNVSYRRLGLFE